MPSARLEVYAVDIGHGTLLGGRMARIPPSIVGRTTPDVVKVVRRIRVVKLVKPVKPVSFVHHVPVLLVLHAALIVELYTPCPAGVPYPLVRQVRSGAATPLALSHLVRYKTILLCA